jgi:EmrB/QacA subfamily drug resistance transporter
MNIKPIGAVQSGQRQTDYISGGPAPRPSVNKTLVLAIILISYVMIVLDISIVITALPKIRAGLNFPEAELSWVQNAYTLSFGGLLLLGARAGDILGRRRMFVLGMSLFTLASLAIGAAQSASWLLAARAVQGVGSAILAPSTLALLTTTFREGRERTRAVGYYGASAGIAASVGLVVGGILADRVSWRMGFFINVPIGLALLAAALRYLRETEKRPGAFDVVGAISSTIGMSALVYGLVRSVSAGWTDQYTLLAIVGAAVLLTLFVLNEWRVKQPIMPLRLFASRERTAALVARMLFLGSMVGFWFFSTQFLQGVLGFSPFTAGFAYLPTTVVTFGTAMMVPKLSERFGNGIVLAVSLALAIVGLAWLSLVSADTSYWSGIALPMVLIGIGQGGSLSPLTVAGISGVKAEDAGAASGLVNVAHQLGGSIGLATLVVIAHAAAGGSDVLPAQVVLAHRVAAAFGAGTMMLAAALVLVLLLIVRPGLAKRLPK